jgi:hypothetical protein
MRKNFTRRLNEKWSTAPKKTCPYYLSKVSIRDDPDALNVTIMVIINTIANNILKIKSSS